MPDTFLSDDDRQELWDRWLEATGEIVTAGLNAMPDEKKAVIAPLVESGQGKLSIVATLHPPAARGVIELPSGEIVVLFEIRDQPLAADLH